jgi:hypothetical protein
MKRKMVKQLLRLVATNLERESAYHMVNFFPNAEGVAVGVIATNPNIVYV